MLVEYGGSRHCFSLSYRIGEDGCSQRKFKGLDKSWSIRYIEQKGECYGLGPKRLS
jgi:hypothetical protein